MRSVLRRFMWWTRRAQKEAELREELQFHLDEEADDRRSDGLSDREARRAARLDLGNPVSLREQVRSEWGWTWAEQIAQDVRYALRMMRSHRAFTAVTVLSLALGIGANTAIYSFMDAVLVRALPVADPASLVVVQWKSHVSERTSMSGANFVMHSMDGSAYDDDGTGLRAGIFPYAWFGRLRQTSSGVLSSVFAYYPAPPVTVLVGGDAEVGHGEYVSGDYFKGLGVIPASGRLLTDDDDRVDAPGVVVVSSGFAQRHFGTADRATGRSIRLNGIPTTIVGVAPPDFFGVDPAAAPEFYLPMHSNLVVNAAGVERVTTETYLDQNHYWIEIMGRLRPGISRTEAQLALAPHFQSWVATTARTGAERGNLPWLVLQDGAGGLEHLRRQYSKPLYMLLTLVALILALACANTASLFLARARSRTREMAVRLSIGAGRFRVVRQLLTESVLLASMGGVAGLIVAAWGIRVLTMLLANGEDAAPLHAELNWHVLLATLTVSVLCGILSGLAPAVQSTRPDVFPALKDSRASVSDGSVSHTGRRLSLGRVLVASQVAMSLLLLVAAALFSRTLANLHAVPLGFNQQNVLLFDVNARQAGHTDPEIAQFYERLRVQLANIPGVGAATLAHSSLIGAGRQLPITVGGADAPGTRILNTGPRFFSTMQIPMRLGRQIDERDRAGSPPVAVVNELFAERNFKGRNPIGQRIALGGPSPREMEVVGVSANVRYQELKDDFVPVVFIPYNQGEFPPIERMTFALRTNGDPLGFVRPVREVVRRADARLPVTDVKTQAAEINQSINEQVVFARLCTGFAVLALLIASVGLYGTTTYAVARRTGEIGIRMALGATQPAVVAMVLGDVLGLVAAGLVVGLPVALGTSRFLDSFLFGLKPTDPASLAIAAAVLASAGLLAGYLPARRASRIDPMTALRQE